MENKYYTPTIEDIRVGYECEVFRSRDNSWWDNQTISKDKLDWLLEKLNKGEVKTRYLTKEQIEAEGWVFAWEIDDFTENGPKTRFYVTTKGELSSEYTINTHEFRIKRGEQVLYDGSCPSINEFRTICRLLNIK